MKYSKQEVMQFVDEEDVKFIRLAFCDVFGRQKNVSIMPGELERAFSDGIAVNASAVKGFGGEGRSDLFLHPDPDTLAILPWRPEHGRVVRMFCTITHPDGTVFGNDTRSILIRAVEAAEKAGYRFFFGTEAEFYLFRLDENGEPTDIPYDRAGYMDVAPDDRGENVRREICLSLEQMGIHPESSHHEEGPGQNEIAFRYSDALCAADNAAAFAAVVKAIAARNGLYADFSPKPIEDKPGNGLHINVSVCAADGRAVAEPMIAGLLRHGREFTAFMNPTGESYKRLGTFNAPGSISAAEEDRSQFIRIPAAYGEYKRAELRSPDPAANPYIAFALMIYAALDGIENGLTIAKENRAEPLPVSLDEAKKAALCSDFIAAHLPQSLISEYCK